MITVKLWKDINAFEPIKGNVLDVDGTIDLIARVKGKTIEEMEEIDIADLLPLFLECVHDVNAKVFEKISQMPKNGNGDSTAI